MDKLSSEIISLIIDNLGPCYLARYVTVSRTWQHEIERRTFAATSVSNEKLSVFTNAFGAPNQHRREFVRELKFRVSMPCDDDSVAGHIDNQEVLREGVTDILAELAGWDDDASVGGTANGPALGSLHLLLDLRLPTSYLLGDSENIVLPSLRYFTLSDEDLKHIPAAVSRITAFSVRVMKGRAMHPVISCQLAHRMPRLEAFELSYYDPPPSKRDLRKAQRAAVCEGLRSLGGAQLPHLKELTVRRESKGAPENHSFRCQDFTDGGVDELCETIRNLVQEKGIQTLELHDVLLSSDLFYDRRQKAQGGEEEPSPSPLWPSMKTLTIHSCIVGADGAWLFSGNPLDEQPVYLNPYDDAIVWDGPDDSGDDFYDDASDHDQDMGSALENGDSPRHQWRTLPDLHGTFNDLNRDLESAMMRMPRLESGHFYIIETGRSERYEVHYYGHGQPDLYGSYVDWGSPRDEDVDDWDATKAIPKRRIHTVLGMAEGWLGISKDGFIIKKI